MSILLPNRKKRISFILNGFFVKKKVITLVNIPKRAKKLLLVLAIFTLVITAKEKPIRNTENSEKTENHENSKNTKNNENDESLKTNLA